MPRSRQVKIVNGDLVGYCLESAVSTWERNGWTRADDGSSEEEVEQTEYPIETQVGNADPEAPAPPAKKTTRKAP
jgi:hypothetical protein